MILSLSSLATASDEVFMNTNRLNRHNLAKTLEPVLERASKYDFRQIAISRKAEAELEAAVLDLNDSQELLRYFSGRRIDLLPHDKLDQLNNFLNQFHNLAGRLINYQHNTTNSWNERTSLSNDTQNLYSNMSAYLMPLVPTLAWTVADAKIKERMSEIENYLDAQIKTWNSNIQSIQTTGQNIIAELQTHISATSVESNAAAIESEVSRFEQSAKNWLAATWVFAIIVILIAIAMILVAYVPKDISIGMAVHIAITKVVLLSTMSAIVLWCSKNYRACQHNVTANRQRVNALKTFRMMAQGTSDAQTRSAIVLQAANSAFSPRATGFEDERSDSGSNQALGVESLLKATGNIRQS